MGDSKRNNDLKLIEDLVKFFKSVSTEQLEKMKYSPRGNSDAIFKRALNEELKRREL
jgi:tRNA A37 methylthiotransferase MiaB